MCIRDRVIVVSATAIASFTFPSFDLTNTVRLLRVPLILMGAVLGLFGLFSGLILIMTLSLIHI